MMRRVRILSVQYNLKDETIESLARPLAEIIRQRLGIKPHWSDGTA